MAKIKRAMLERILAILEWVNDGDDDGPCPLQFPECACMTCARAEAQALIEELNPRVREV